MRHHRDVNGREVTARGVTLRRISGHTEEVLLVQDDQGTTLAFISSNGVVYSRAGFQVPGFTTAQRDGIAQVDRPTGLVIRNTDNNQLEEQIGTSAAPVWRSVGSLASEINQAGPLVSRPSASSVPVGTQYFAFDDLGGTLYRSNGSVWQKEACSVDDPRLSDQRVPPDGSVTPAKIAPGYTFNFTRLMQNGMDVARDANGPDRHFEAGQITVQYAGFSSSAGGSYWFVHPYAYIPVTVIGLPDVGNPPPQYFGTSILPVSSQPHGSGHAGEGEYGPPLNGAGTYSYSDGYPGCLFRFWAISEGPDY